MCMHSSLCVCLFRCVDAVHVLLSYFSPSRFWYFAGFGYFSWFFPVLRLGCDFMAAKTLQHTPLLTQPQNKRQQTHTHKHTHTQHQHNKNKNATHTHTQTHTHTHTQLLTHRNTQPHNHQHNHTQTEHKTKQKAHNEVCECQKNVQEAVKWEWKYYGMQNEKRCVHRGHWGNPAAHARQLAGTPKTKLGTKTKTAQRDVLYNGSADVTHLQGAKPASTQSTTKLADGSISLMWTQRRSCPAAGPHTALCVSPHCRKKRGRAKEIFTKPQRSLWKSQRMQQNNTKQQAHKNFTHTHDITTYSYPTAHHKNTHTAQHRHIRHYQ